MKFSNNLSPLGLPLPLPTTYFVIIMLGSALAANTCSYSVRNTAPCLQGVH